MDRGTKLRYSLSAIFLLIILVTTIYVSSQPKQKSNLCTGTPGGNVVILMDYSDIINVETTHAEIKRRIEKIISDDSKVKPNDRVSVFALTDDPAKVKPLFDFCRPATGGNPLVTNPDVQNAFLAFFKKHLTEAIEKKPAEVKSSPIIEMLSVIGRTSYFNENRRSLFVFSDLIQYNKGSVNLYKTCTGEGSPVTKAQTALASYRKDNSSFPQLQLSKDVNVELYQIPRPELKIQQSCLTAFWQDAFGQATPSITPLP
jgi:hypothetical protein